MRRILVIAGAVAAMAAFSNRAMAAHTAAELHIFFGAPVGSPGAIPASPSAADIGTNPLVVLPLNSSTILPIWARVLGGDGTQSFSALGFKVYSEGDTTNFSNASNSSNAVFPSTSQFVPAVAGSGAANTGIATLKEFRGTYFTQVAAGGSNLGLGTYLLGYMEVATGGVANKNIDLFFSVGGSAAFLIAGANSTATLNTVAFGAGDTAGLNGVTGSNLNTFRRGNTNADVTGTVFDQVSTLADAHISSIPEPTTLALLSLGLLAARRRKTA